MHFDVFLKDQMVAFEYQGEQHYHDIYSLGPRWLYTQRDKEKRDECKRREITLIEVPYWWDAKAESLLATIHKHRPDLIPAAMGTPIPASPPRAESPKSMPPIFRADMWDGSQDLTDWFRSSFH